MFMHPIRYYAPATKSHTWLPYKQKSIAQLASIITQDAAATFKQSLEHDDAKGVP